MKLDSWTQAGLTMAQFYNLFVRCASCGLVMMKRAFYEHDTGKCYGGSDGGAASEMIDITADAELDVE
jgi:hypothetical protein